MKHIGSLILCGLSFSCMSGSMTIKKDSQRGEIDICQPWSGKRATSEQIKSFSTFVNSDAAMKVEIAVAWYELNYWFIFVVPTYGLLKYPDTPKLTIKYTNISNRPIHVNHCLLQFFYKSDATPILASKFDDILDCSKPNFMKLLPSETVAINTSYKGLDFAKIMKVRFNYKTEEQKKKSDLEVNLLDHWAFCTMSIN